MLVVVLFQVLLVMVVMDNHLPYLVQPLHSQEGEAVLEVLVLDILDQEVLVVLVVEVLEVLIMQTELMLLQVQVLVVVLVEMLVIQGRVAQVLFI